MRFTFDVFTEYGNRRSTHSNLEAAVLEKTTDFSAGDVIKVTDNLRKTNTTLYTLDDVEAWQVGQERAFQWADACDRQNWKERVSENVRVFSDRNHALQLQTPCGGKNAEMLKEADAVKEKDHINPSHYQGFMVTETDTLQWLEAQQYHVRYRGKPEVFKGAVELQARKYLDRNGGKDEELQELKKALWYMKFLVAFVANGDKPIRVADIPRLLGEK